MLSDSLDICFILVEPAVPENIGAAARAIKTMGFSDFRLVNPKDQLSEMSRRLAHGSGDILEAARIFGSLQEALSDVDFTIGTTAKIRTTKQDYYAPERAAELVMKKSGMLSRIAIVFGREESGLTNDELRICDIASSIPLKNPYPSLNLSQAVMLYAYVFSGLAFEQPDGARLTDKAYTELKENAAGILRILGIQRNENLYYRLLERLASASAEDSRLLLSLVGKLLPVLQEKPKE